MSRAMLRPTGWATLVSGVAAAIGIVFLVAMFASFAVGATSSGQAFGRINDVLVMVSYLLAAPSVLALSALLRSGAPVLSSVLTLIGLGAIVAIVALQYQLIVGALTFEGQVGLVSVALLVLGVWFVVTGYLGSASGEFHYGVRMGLIAATYVGYPIWAIWSGRRFLALTADPQPRPLAIMEE
jgi:hypothetical protein